MATKDQKSDKDAKAKAAKPAGKPAQDAKPAAKEARAKQPKADKPVEHEAAPTQPPRLKVYYNDNVVPALMKQFGYKTRMQVPRVTKITLNMGVGEAVADKKILENAGADVSCEPATPTLLPLGKRLRWSRAICCPSCNRVWFPCR